ncbi:reverse transcriptase domain-containing protein [Tanacetum coccineum]
MAALVISISSDLSDESVGSSIPRVILIGSISIEVLVASEVGVAVVASPAGVRELDTHSSSEAGPSESSPPPVSVAPIVSPFLCSDDSESNTEMPERNVSPTPHDAMLARALTVRKLVRPLPFYPLALRYTPHHLDRFTFGSSSNRSSLDHSSSTHSTSDHSSFGHSTSDHSSSGHSTSGHSLSGHTPPVTTIADSSTPSRLVYPPLARTSRYIEAYRRWSYLPDHLARDVGPLLLPCLHIPALGALVPSRADLLPPRKRFRDSISLEDSVEEDIDADVLADIEADAIVVEVVVDMDVEVGVDAGIGIEVDVGVDVEDERVEDIKMGQRELEARSLIANGERASLLDHVTSLERSNARLRGTLMMESARADRFWRRMFFMERKLRQIRSCAITPSNSKKDFQDSPGDKEDTRSSQEYMNDLEEEYLARALLAKSKRFFKKVTQRISSAKATDQTECHKCGKKGHFARDCWSKTSVPSYRASAPSSTSSKNKGLIAETCDWDEEEVSSDDNEVTEVKALMALTDEERVSVGKESAKNCFDEIEEFFL